jgi:hypothetical protein
MFGTLGLPQLVTIFVFVLILWSFVNRRDRR